VSCATQSRSSGEPSTGGLGLRRQQRVRVQEADRPQAVLALVLEPARDARADLAGADDQGRAADEPVRTGRAHGGDQPHATEADEHDRGAPQVRGDGGDELAADDVDLADDHRHRRHGDRPGDRHGRVEDARVQAALVHAAHQQQQHRQRREQHQRPGVGDRQRLVRPPEGQQHRGGEADEVQRGAEREQAATLEDDVQPRRPWAAQDQRGRFAHAGDTRSGCVQGHRRGALPRELDGIHGPHPGHRSCRCGA
jgi:hypothetical protein